MKLLGMLVKSFIKIPYLAPETALGPDLDLKGIHSHNTDNSEQAPFLQSRLNLNDPLQKKLNHNQSRILIRKDWLRQGSLL